VGAEELSLLKFGIYNFFAVLMGRQIFTPSATVLCKIAKSIINAEPEPNKELLKQVDTIYTKTHEKVKENLAIVELAVFKNIDRGLNREIQIGDKEFTIVELYRYLDEVSLRLTDIVVGIAKRYTFEIPTEPLGTGTHSSINIGLGSSKPK
jgi:hypothetical protein